MSRFSLSLKKLCLTGNVKTARGRARGYSVLQSIAVGLARSQRCLPRRRGSKGRCVVRSPKAGEVVILSMMIKNWVPAKAPLCCMVLILGTKIGVD